MRLLRMPAIGAHGELAAEHVALQELSEQVHRALHTGGDVATPYAELTRLLAVHSAEEEVGLFPQARELASLDEHIDALVRDHEELHALFGDGPGGQGVPAGLKLLAQHIDDEEYGLFPHVFHALDPEQWDEVALGHLAVEAAFTEPAVS